ncbi:MAG: hypothetical protein ACRD7E_05520 [Bryobacteraceae bacterium]
MRAFASVVLSFFTCTPLIYGSDTAAQARLLEKEGDAMGARALLAQASQSAPADLATLSAYAEFLDRHRSPEARATYEKLLHLLNRPEDKTKAAQIARRLVVLDLLASDRDAAARHLNAYKENGGTDLSLDDLRAPAKAPESAPVALIPGPLQSFARMAALSPDLRLDEVLPALARNVVTNGYQATASNESLEQTEYLKLVVRYLSQAREIEKLAGEDHKVNIETCDSAQTGELLRVLGYRMRGGCGSDVVLETVNATRAFLTIDSGFPLAELEQALRTNRPFNYDFSPTQVTVIYGHSYWLPEDKQPAEFIDVFLSDPALCRLYLGLSRMDINTAEELKKQMPMQRLKAFAHVLDFYGGMFQIRNGSAVVPGGPAAYPGWRELAGKSPEEGAAFLERIITRDDGWMASFYDALARISGPTRDYLLEPKRMQRFYGALRGKVTSPGPARPVFRSSTDMMLLTQRLRLEPDGSPHVPGDLEVWKNLFIKHPHGKYDGKLTKAASGWKEPDDLVEALFALCRKAVENEPLKIYMALSDINRFRSQPLQAATVDRLARAYRHYGAQYAIFTESPNISDETILQYMDTAEAISKIRNQALRADTAGTFQSLVGLWQILCRQRAIPAGESGAVLAGLLEGFAKVRSHSEVFDSGRTGTRLLLKAAGIEGSSSQDQMIDLLAGGIRHQESEAHQQVVREMIQFFEAQRLVSLDTLFELADHLDSLSKGGKLNLALVNKLASRVAEIELPRASLTAVEKNAMAFGYWTEKHVDAQRKLNLRALIDRAAGDPEKLDEIRGRLAPVLRDTLVGLNYIHYAPPGAQLLQTNPLFVRSHDFLGLQGSPQTWKSTEVFGTGWPSSAGGRLVGSLSGLPYALAEAEQNFLVPSREQALIWGDLVPQMILAAKVPRWWNVSPQQMHWVNLHMNKGQSLIAESALDSALRAKVVALLDRHAPPARLDRVDRQLQAGDVAGAIDLITPAEMFLLAGDWWSANRDDPGILSEEARRLSAEMPERVSYAAISRAFGTPKPTLTNSYQPELLHIRTFPTLMGYSSRIMAESWESNLLYYAALADELHVPPAQLNVLVPAWTQQTVQRIFATHLEDWPALLRSLRLVGDDVRESTRRQMLLEQKASLQ